jgi:hypothetical protein
VQVWGGSDDSDDSDKVEDISPGIGRPPAPATLRTSNPLANVRKTWSEVRNIPDDDPDDDPELPTTWVCLEHPRSHQRVYYSDQHDDGIGTTMARGFKVRKTFTQEKDARKWLNNNEHEITNLAEPPAVTPTESWVGLEHPVSHIRVYYENTHDGKIDHAVDLGYRVCKKFFKEKYARHWANSNIQEITIGSERGSRSSRVTRKQTPAVKSTVVSSNYDDYDNELPEETFRSGYNRGTISKRRTKKDIPSDDNDSDDDKEGFLEYETSRLPRKSGKPPLRDANKSWFGVERETRQHRDRAITASVKVLKELQHKEYKLEEVFPTKVLAEAWLNESSSDGYDSDSSADDVQFSAPRTRQKVKSRTTSHHQPTRTGSNQVPVVPTTKAISLATVDFYTAETAGEDPSVGNPELIYGIVHDDIDVMDAALCPPFMTPEDRGKLLNTVVDITALPGMFRSNDLGDFSLDAEIATSIVATALGKEATKANAVWNTPARNSLSKIKSQAQLEDMIVGVEKSGKLAFQQQEGRMKAIMYKCNYDRSSIQLYLQAGLLPRMMRYSYQRYLSLLYKARQKVLDHGCWENSLGSEMIAHHASSTLYERYYASDWRTFMIKTYLYLRDADKNSYVDTTMYEGLYKLVRNVAPPDNTKYKPPIPDGPNTCSHCRCPINEAHMGGKHNCFFKDLDGRAAKECGRLFMIALKASPKMDRGKKAKEIIEENGGVK